MNSFIRPCLNSAGYPLNPESIFVSVRREYLPTREQWTSVPPHSYPEVSLPVRQFGQWETLVGFVSIVREFADGIVVEFSQNLNRSFLKWPNAVLWIPNHGTAGILN